MNIGEIVTGPFIVTFKEEIPDIGEQSIIVLADDTEINIRFLKIGKWNWHYENGMVVGLITDIEAVIIDDVRPTSRGKLKLV